ncbi:MAG TPA: hypothetical protein VF121_15370 [Thermoanaerobaculia bacterium]|nr:hypothetical protein [Thermoanaerobaculia bacterium]
MSDPLATYLQDHLAGSVLAVDLLEALRGEHAGEPLGELAAGLLVEVEADRTVLQGLVERVGAGPSPIKEAAAWLGEKVSRLKLHRDAAGELGAFQALEVLALGILGKRALWRALAAAAPADERLRGLDFAHLATRAQAQHDRVEEQRLASAREALRPARD